MLSWREPIKVLADVIRDEMSLDAGHIMLSFQKWGIPQDDGLYVALSVLSGKPIGNNNFLEDAGTDAANEVQQVAMQELVQIDVMSFGESARARKEEILMALASQRCLRAQGDYGFQIARVPQGFANASSLEETKYLNRYTTTLIIKSIKTKVKAAEFYDTFATTEVHSNE
jgi:hypothetical protein